MIKYNYYSEVFNELGFNEISLEGGNDYVTL